VQWTQLKKNGFYATGTPKGIKAVLGGLLGFGSLCGPKPTHGRCLSGNGFLFENIYDVVGAILLWLENVVYSVKRELMVDMHS